MGHKWDNRTGGWGAYLQLLHLYITYTVKGWSSQGQRHSTIEERSGNKLFSLLQLPIYHWFVPSNGIYIYHKPMPSTCSVPYSHPISAITLVYLRCTACVIHDVVHIHFLHLRINVTVEGNNAKWYNCAPVRVNGYISALVVLVSDLSATISD